MAPCQTNEPTILIVEDDETLRESLANLLRLEGYAVAEAGDGRAALNYLRGDRQPCVILLDLMMPIMDGWEFRERQQENPRLADIPVVVTTAVSAEYRQENRLDAAAYFIKPFDVPRLLDTVQQFCS